MINESKRNQLLYIGMILLFMFGYQNCSGPTASTQFKQSTTQNSEGLDTTQPNNKPLIDCDFTSSQRPDVYMTVSTLDTQFSQDRFNEDDTFHIDCSGTSDESDNAQLSFEIDRDYDASNPNFQPLTQGSQADSYNPGRYTMALRVTDPSGEASIKAFDLVVECNDNVPAPSVDNPSSAIQVVEGSNVGTWNYSIDPSSVSGGQDYQYAWDFNGDGVFDPFGENRSGSNQIWSSSTSHNNIYANVENNVNVGLQIMNSCYKSTTVYVDKNLVSTHGIARNATSLAETRGYYYLQGDMEHTGGSNSALDLKRKTRDYLATDNPTHLTFDCDYKFPRNGGAASLEIDTLKQYRDEAVGIHGMAIAIDNIPDDGNTGAQTIDYGQANMTNILADLAGENDSLVRNDRYSKLGSCDVKMRLIKSVSTSPCSSGPARTTRSIEILGEFSCDNLVNSTGDTISVTNGKFRCGDSISDRCQGGVGGSGGQPPPQF